jgi:hypothetical protein
LLNSVGPNDKHTFVTDKGGILVLSSRSQCFNGVEDLCISILHVICIGGMQFVTYLNTVIGINVELMHFRIYVTRRRQLLNLVPEPDPIPVSSFTCLR